MRSFNYYHYLSNVVIVFSICVYMGIQINAYGGPTNFNPTDRFFEDWPDTFIKPANTLISKGFLARSSPYLTQFIVLTKGEMFQTKRWENCVSTTHEEEDVLTTTTKVFTSSKKMSRELNEYSQKVNFEYEQTTGVPTTMQQKFKFGLELGFKQVREQVNEVLHSEENTVTHSLKRIFRVAPYKIQEVFQVNLVIKYYKCRQAGDKVKENKKRYPEWKYIRMTDPKRYNKLFTENLKDGELECTAYLTTDSTTSSLSKYEVDCPRQLLLSNGNEEKEENNDKASQEAVIGSRKKGCLLAPNTQYNEEWSEHFIKSESELVQNGYFGKSDIPHESQFIILTQAKMVNKGGTSYHTNKSNNSFEYTDSTQIEGYSTTNIPSGFKLDTVQDLHKQSEYLDLKFQPYEKDQSATKANVKHMLNATFQRTQGRISKLLNKNSHGFGYYTMEFLVPDSYPGMNSLYILEFTLQYYKCSLHGDKLKENKKLYPEWKYIQKTDPKRYKLLFTEHLNETHVECNMYLAAFDTAESVLIEVTSYDPGHKKRYIPGSIFEDLITEDICPTGMLQVGLGPNVHIVKGHQYEKPNQNNKKIEDNPSSADNPSSENNPSSDSSSIFRQDVILSNLFIIGVAMNLTLLL